MSDPQPTSAAQGDPAQPSRSGDAGQLESAAVQTSLPRAALVSVGLAAVAFSWAYWPTFLKLLRAWSVEPDYSHGYFIVPVAIYFLWIKRDARPALAGPAWGGLALIAAALAMHLAGSFYYLEALNGWSMIVWLAGATWLLGGWALLCWALPALVFLVFMVPLPYRLESLFRQPLQRFATEVSCWSLQSFGFPALAEGNVISIGDVSLEVAQACSGLRIFVSIIALATAYAIVARRPWRTKLLVFAGALPIAVLANATRVTLVGALHYGVSDAAANRLSHDLAGLFVIVLAAALMAGLIWYLNRLIVEVQPLAGHELLHDWDRPRRQA